MTSTPTSTLKRDPVCGMMVDPATAKAKSEHAGETYFFCHPGCAQEFRDNPEQYLNSKPSSTGLPTLGTSKAETVPASPKSSRQAVDQPAYVCPMCPEVRDAKPGPCPSCGMALEPERLVSQTKTEYTCPMHPQIVRLRPG